MAGASALSTGSLLQLSQASQFTHLSLSILMNGKLIAPHTVAILSAALSTRANAISQCHQPLPPANATN